MIVSYEAKGIHLRSLKINKRVLAYARALLEYFGSTLIRLTLSKQNRENLPISKLRTSAEPRYLMSLYNVEFTHVCCGFI